MLDRAQRLQRQFFTHAKVAWEPRWTSLKAAIRCEMHVALPGVSADAITVAIDPAGITISAVRAFPCRGEGQIHRLEIPTAASSAIGVSLDDPYSPLELAGKSLQDGILTLTFRRKEVHERGVRPRNARRARRTALEDALIVIPMRNTVLFPGVISPITVGRARLRSRPRRRPCAARRRSAFPQRDAADQRRQAGDLYWVGTAGSGWCATSPGPRHATGHRWWPLPGASNSFEASFLVARVQFIEQKEEMNRKLRGPLPATRPRRASPLTSFLNASASTCCASRCADPEGARRGRRAGRARRARRSDRRRRDARGSREARAQGAEAPRAHARGRRRVLDGAHLPRLADRAAVATPEPRPIDIARGARILDEDHYGLDKVKRRILEYLAVRKLNPGRASPILCFVGPPGVGKTSLGRVDRARAGRKFVRACAGRRARRGRDPRPPAHLHRRAAGQHHPGIRKAGAQQPGLHARRDRQARRRLPRRPGVGAARGARSRAELDLPRSLPRRAVRSVAGDVHRHRERARHDPRAAARPHGDHRAARLHRAGEARDRARYLVPKQLDANGLKPEQCEITDDGARWRSSTTTRARRACATSSARSARSAPRRGADRRGQKRRKRGHRRGRICRDPRPAQVRGEVALRTSVPGVATGLAWTPVGGDILFIEATRCRARAS